eukprot:3269608-Pleurochrysis_carterae.AAC.2
MRTGTAHRCATPWGDTSGKLSRPDNNARCRCRRHSSITATIHAVANAVGTSTATQGTGADTAANAAVYTWLRQRECLVKRVLPMPEAHSRRMHKGLVLRRHAHSQRTRGSGVTGNICTGRATAVAAVAVHAAAGCASGCCISGGHVERAVVTLVRRVALSPRGRLKRLRQTDKRSDELKRQPTQPAEAEQQRRQQFQWVVERDARRGLAHAVAAASNTPINSILLSCVRIGQDGARQRHRCQQPCGGGRHGLEVADERSAAWLASFAADGDVGKKAQVQIGEEQSRRRHGRRRRRRRQTCVGLIPRGACIEQAQKVHAARRPLRELDPGTLHAGAHLASEIRISRREAEHRFQQLLKHTQHRVGIAERGGAKQRAHCSDGLLDRRQSCGGRRRDRVLVHTVAAEVEEARLAVHHVPVAGHAQAELARTVVALPTAVWVLRMTQRVEEAQAVRMASHVRAVGRAARHAAARTRGARTVRPVGRSSNARASTRCTCIKRTGADSEGRGGHPIDGA